MLLEEESIQCPERGDGPVRQATEYLILDGLREGRESRTGGVTSQEVSRRSRRLPAGGDDLGNATCPRSQRGEPLFALGTASVHLNAHIRQEQSELPTHPLVEAVGRPDRSPQGQAPAGTEHTPRLG